MRSGDAYVAGLRDGRAVYLDGERVDDVTKHPAFVEPIRRIAETYDRAKPPRVTRPSRSPIRRRGAPQQHVARPALGRGSRARRRLHRFWAEPSFGLLGRTPDHVACVLTAFSAWRHLFDGGGSRFGDHVERFYARARDEDLYVTYAIVPPQVDRSRPAHRHPEPFLHPGVVRETSAGIVVRGAHAIATSATMADWLFVSYITPLVPGDEDYAISLVRPMNAEGLRLYPRRPFASQATTVFDYPLSSRFDEVDTTVVFNDVVVPWEQVFIYRNVDLVNAQFHDSPRTRRRTSGAGPLRREARVHGRPGDAPRRDPDRGRRCRCQATLGGEIASLCAAFDALVKAAERDPLITRGYARPHPQYIYAGMGSSGG
jgi:4-hydroxyphenylacetate 3-monooxygenase